MKELTTKEKELIKKLKREFTKRTFKKRKKCTSNRRTEIIRMGIEIDRNREKKYIADGS